MDTTMRNVGIRRRTHVNLVTLVAAVLVAGASMAPAPAVAPARAVAPTQAVTEAQSAAPATCDIAADGGTPCVAAYSSVRALYGSYSGPLYTVSRQSDGATYDVSTLTAGGYANAAGQDAFCVDTVCLVTKIHDQSPKDNDLTIAPVGLAGSTNFGVRADALPIVAEGHNVYGLLFDAGTGYRKMVGAGVPTGAEPESIYAVLSGTYITQVDRCCFGFGNAETVADNTGSAHMDALNISTVCTAAPCSGVGPWWQADLENGTFMSGGASNPSNVSMGWDKPFVTGVLRNDGKATFALDGGDATAPTLTSLYSGALPPGYAPMKKEGGIILGIGGDNSNAASGAFFEGAITTGTMTNSTVASIQTDIDAVNYTGTTGGGTGVPVAYPAGGKCMDVAGNDTGGNGAAVTIGPCTHDAVDQRWTTTNGLVSGPLKSLNRCLDVAGGGSASGTAVQLSDCSGSTAQEWVQQTDGTLLNPTSNRCLTSPGGSVSTGTQLVIDTCTGAASQRFWVAYPHRPINAPAGKCLDVAGANLGTVGTDVMIGQCKREEVDQYWRQNADQTITSLGLCLDIDGGATASGTQVSLRTCGTARGQKWVQQDNGALLNPQSGRCLTAPSTVNGTVLEIRDCTGKANQKFPAIGGQAYNSGGHPVNAPGGKCVDVVGDDQYGNWFGVEVQLWSCLPGAADQHWIYKADDQTLRTLTRCMDIKGNLTAAGTGVHLFNCNGVGGQKWVQQPDGTLKNPQSGLCLTTTGGAMANGTRLEIQPCTGATSQRFMVTGAVGLSPGARVSLQATSSCCTGSYARHAFGKGVLSSVSAGSSLSDKDDASWIVRPGLSKPSCVSFESSNYANGYLRQSGSEIRQEANDGTAAFATDATFCAIPGKNGQGVSLRWAGNPALFLRHYNGRLYIASNGGANAWDSPTSWAADVSWSPVAPWVA